MKKVICDHAGISEKWCKPKWCAHCKPHEEYDGCKLDECGYVSKVVKCVEAPDE